MYGAYIVLVDKQLVVVIILKEEEDLICLKSLFLSYPLLIGLYMRECCSYFAMRFPPILLLGTPPLLQPFSSRPPTFSSHPCTLGLTLDGQDFGSMMQVLELAGMSMRMVDSTHACNLLGMLGPFHIVISKQFGSSLKIRSRLITHVHCILIQV